MTTHSPIGPVAEDGRPSCRATDPASAGRVERDRERLGQRALDGRHPRRQGHAVALRGQGELGHAAGELAVVAEEEELAAGVGPARPALVAVAAGDGRLDRRPDPRA